MRKPSTWRLVWHFGGNAVYQDRLQVLSRRATIAERYVIMKRLPGLPTAPDIRSLRGSEPLEPFAATGSIGALGILRTLAQEV